jgi:hypothetical protein
MKHLEKNNETYFSHMLFAGKIGLTLILRGVVFMLHALLPVCELPRFLNLEDTSKKLYEWNEYSIRRRTK